MSDKKPLLIGLAVLAVLAVGAAIFSMTRSSAPPAPVPDSAPATPPPATTPDGQPTQPMRGQ